MNPESILTSMTQTSQAIRSLASGISDEQARWKPAPDSWSILEVLCHLLDEERYDFRVRLDFILHKPGQPWPPIDPQGWVSARHYNEQDPAEILGKWLQERQASLEWLRSLNTPDWQSAEQAPWGALHAGDMLASWAAHDLLHLRRLVELRYANHNLQAQPYSPAYAGDW